MLRNLGNLKQVSKHGIRHLFQEALWNFVQVLTSLYLMASLSVPWSALLAVPLSFLGKAVNRRRLQCEGVDSTMLGLHARKSLMNMCIVRNLKPSLALKVRNWFWFSMKTVFSNFLLRSIYNSGSSIKFFAPFRGTAGSWTGPYHDHRGRVLWTAHLYYRLPSTWS